MAANSLNATTPLFHFTTSLTEHNKGLIINLTLLSDQIKRNTENNRQVF